MEEIRKRSFDNSEDSTHKKLTGCAFVVGSVLSRGSGGQNMENAEGELEPEKIFRCNT